MSLNPSAQPALLMATDLGKTYWLGRQPVIALRQVSLAIQAGEFTALSGPSGSGKTTLLNLLGLLDEPTAGHLHVDGENSQGFNEPRRAAIRLTRFGFIFQTFNLIPVLSARENIEYPLALRKIDKAARRERVQHLLASVGLEDKATVRPDLLSGGQRQRVAIARALANDPEIVFADEPTANLDSRTAGEILDLMRALNAQKQVAFLFATHDPRVVERAHRQIVLHDGAIVEDRRA